MNSSSEEPISIPSSVDEPQEEVRQRSTLKDHAIHYVRILGQFVRLLIGLMLDPRVDKKVKIFAASVLTYVFSPVDFIPELFSGLFGMLDDFVLSAFALNVILNWVDPEIVRSHWKGEEDLLSTIQKGISNAEILIPEAILKKIQNWIGRHTEKALVPVQVEQPAIKRRRPKKSE